MEDTTISIGDKIELTHIKSHIGRRYLKKFGSQLLDYDGVRTAKILMPILEGRIIPLEVGDEYSLCFYTNAGLYQCNGCITKRYLEKKMYVLSVEFTTPLKRFQRRKFYRLECLLTVKFRVISDKEKELLEILRKNEFNNDFEKKVCESELEIMPKEWKEGTVSDLSGGGIRFHGKVELNPDDEVEIVLPLSLESGTVSMNLMAKVIICDYHEDSRNSYEIRGEYIGMLDSNRELIIKYVFEEQRRKMKKD